MKTVVQGKVGPGDPQGSAFLWKAHCHHFAAVSV